MTVLFTDVKPKKRHARPITLLIIKTQAQVSKQLSTCYLHFYGTKNAPEAVGAYSQAVKAGSFVFTSGQLPVNPDTGSMPEAVEEQARQSMKNVGAVIEAAGGDYSHIVKTTVLLSDIGDFTAVNRVL